MASAKRRLRESPVSRAKASTLFINASSREIAVFTVIQDRPFCKHKTPSRYTDSITTVYTEINTDGIRLLRRSQAGDLTYDYAEQARAFLARLRGESDDAP